jgi:hypothetical protein
MSELAADSLHGSWVHSHEEDTDTEMVFRPPDHDFPPSRGRRALALEPDGRFFEQGPPGPDDRPLGVEGTWELAEDDTLVLSGEAEAEPVRAMRIASAEPDRLVVRK